MFECFLSLSLQLEVSLKNDFIILHLTCKIINWHNPTDYREENIKNWNSFALYVSI